MIPSHYNIEVVEGTGQPSRTYTFCQTTKRIFGRVDGLDAVKQFVSKTLNTERFAYVIYDDQYGIEFEPLLGQSPDYVSSVLEYRITDALTADDRFIGLRNFQIGDIKDDTITFSATVVCTYGTFSIDSGVN